MNADRLLAHYEKVADAPDAIVRLRRFILDLAARGKLVAAGPERRTGGGVTEADCRAEKARLVKAREIRNTSLESPLSTNDQA